MTRFIVFLLLFGLANSRSLAQDIEFELVGEREGLNFGTHAIAQDSLGFLWIATFTHLYRYDGYSFRVFKNDPQDPGSISENWIFALYEDKDKELWIGTAGGGLVRYNRNSETFKAFRHDEEDPGSLSYNSVRAVYQDKDGILWVGTPGSSSS